MLKLLIPLKAKDKFAVFAVDSQPHEVVDLTRVEHADSFIDDILQIQSAGGGIYVYNGLVAATDVLMKAKDINVRHIVLFADAADAEQPGDYRELLKRATAVGVTVSVVGLGSQFDCDAEFLRDVAKRGNGMCYFNQDAHELPRIFIQDVFIMARNTFVEEKTATDFTKGVFEISPYRYNEPFNVDGYNLCFLRPEAKVAVATKDDNNAPVVAYWQVGLGRVACFTGEVDGSFAGSFASWEKAGTLLTSLVQWSTGLGGNGPDNRILATQRLDNGVLRLKLHLDPERKVDPFNCRPEVSLIKSSDQTTLRQQQAVMKWDSADSLIFETELKGSETCLPTILLDGKVFQVMAPVKLPYSPEFRPVRENKNGENVIDFCRMTGGFELSDVADVWDNLPKSFSYVPLVKWLLLIAIIVFLMEIYERRTKQLFNFVVLRKERLSQKKEKSKFFEKRVKVKKKKIKRVKKNRTCAGMADETDDFVIDNKNEKVISKEDEDEDEPQSGLLEALNKMKK